MLQERKPPFAITTMGRTYRNEATDATHDYMFMQFEIMIIDTKQSLSNLIAIAQEIFRCFFKNNELKSRIRPGFFPFVEPGIEVDIQCPFCQNGCSICKRTTWIEAGGAGLVHPNVLELCGVDSTKYTACAFGFGLTRLVMLKYGINDVRLLHGCSLDFLKQF
jgi:phenylalanyl-tRNA synthetase alpha chain